MGILVVQVYFYYITFPKDRFVFKALGLSLIWIHERILVSYRCGKI